MHWIVAITTKRSFRPLIRGFFFYIKKGSEFVVTALDGFPSPHSGILFLYTRCGIVNADEESFRPLIRGFFFYKKYNYLYPPAWNFVSVPSFGDSFFITIAQLADRWSCSKSFPSPHSGILFLSCRYDMPPSLNIFAIFRRILHLLAQKGFSLTQSIHFSPYPSASARIKSFFIHIVPSPIPLNQYIITSSSFISPMPHDLTLVWS